MGASKNIWFVIPAKAGIQYFIPGSRLSSGRCLDPGFRRGDVFREVLLSDQIILCNIIDDIGQMNCL